MANTTSAKKMVRKIERRTEVNKRRKSRARTFFKRVELAITDGDKKTAVVALGQADKEGQKAVTAGVFHRKTISRKVSRLAKRISTLS